MGNINFNSGSTANVAVAKGGTGGIGFGGLLAILFIALKLTGYIDWSWIWVLAPLWIPLAIVTGLFVLILLVVAVVGIFGAIFGRR